MRRYFQLQFLIIKRKLNDFGLNPILGFFLTLFVFLALSIYLFSKTKFAAYIFILVALGFVSKLSNKKRNDFLKSVYSFSTYIIMRMLENSIIALPFIIFLIYKQLYVPVLILVSITMLMAIVNINSTYNYTIPTPFYKKPFEFTVGFRNTFYLFFFAYFLALIAVSVSNFNLGGFALLFIFFVSYSFYSKPENEYYVWSFSKPPNEFLSEKIKIALIHSTILNFPVLVILGIFFLHEINTTLLLTVSGYVYLITIILAKYSAYPNEMNLPQGILIGISLLFPPVLIVIIPFFYFQSTKRLNNILE